MTASTESAPTRKAVSVARARKGLKATDARAMVGRSARLDLCCCEALFGLANVKDDIIFKLH